MTGLFILCLLVLLGALKAQLQVEIRLYDQTQELENYRVLAAFTFPRGFSTDWFVTTFANIPAEGITGLLYHPYPPNGCSSLNYSLDCELDLGNLSKIAILDEYHVCTQQKIISIQEAAFDAMITYSSGDSAQDVGNDVYDKSTGKTVEIEASGIPVAVVSEHFASMLVRTACISNINNNCPAGNITLVNLSVGSINIKSVRIALVAFIMFCGLLGIFVQFLFWFLIAFCCNKLLKCRGRSGRYNVHENQMHELGEFRQPGGRFCGTHILPYTPKQHEFHCGEAEDADIQCAICLENFVESEVVSVLCCDGNHVFHPACIDKWLDSQSTCPVCRTLMTPTYT